MDVLGEGSVQEGSPTVLPLERRAEVTRWLCAAPCSVSVGGVAKRPLFDLADVSSSYYGRFAQVREADVAPTGELIRGEPLVSVVLPPQLPVDLVPLYVAAKLCAAESHRWMLAASAIGEVAKLRRARMRGAAT
jgi:hypothetical protein